MNPEEQPALQPLEPQAVANPAATEQPAVAPAAPFASAKEPPPFRVFALGNAGANVLEALIRRGAARENCVLLNSDAASLASSSAGEKLSIDGAQARGLGSGGDPERGRTGAEALKDKLDALCKNVRGAVILSGMGGGAGTGAAPVVARAAKAAGALVVALPVMPFECEGPIRRRVALSGVKDLLSEATVVLPFSNERVVTTQAKQTLLDTFKVANELVACSAHAVYHAFASASLMGLTFADICSLMSDRSDDCVFAAVEASGADRAKVAADKLIAHPALHPVPNILPESDAVGLYVIGGPNLGMDEVTTVVERTAQECGSSPLMMGAAIHPDLGESLIVLLLAGKERQAERELRRAASPELSRTPAAFHGDVSEADPGGRPKSRTVPPPPEITQTRAREILSETTGGRRRKPAARMRQTQLPLDIISRGRFDKSEPTIHKGEDLDVPTYVRRGISLN